MVSHVGLTAQAAQSGLTYATTLAFKLNKQRDAVSAVSMDEEMVNMVQFQSAYTAAAKLVSAVDEMLQSLIAMV